MVRSGFPLLLAGLALLLPLGEARGDRPEVTLQLSVAEDQVEIGEDIHVTATLERKAGHEVEVNALRLGRGSVTLSVALAGRTHVITRIFGDILRKRKGGPFRLVPSPSPRTMLARGHPLSLEVVVPAIRCGKLTIRAAYSGFSAGTPPLESDPVEVEVDPKGKCSSLLARIATAKGTFEVKLWPNHAWNTVSCFVKLARAGFYDGLVFHRILAGFLIQGGDPKGDGTGGPGFFLPDEGDKSVKHVRGVVSLARVPSIPDTGGSQFFVLLRDAPKLDGRYTAFGKVVKGMDVVDALGEVKVKRAEDGERSLPLEPPVIRSIRILSR